MRLVLYIPSQAISSMREGRWSDAMYVMLSFRALRMQSIIHEEASKPLSLPEPFVRDYDSERANQDESYLKVSH